MKKSDPAVKEATQYAEQLGWDVSKGFEGPEWRAFFFQNFSAKTGKPLTDRERKKLGFCQAKQQREEEFFEKRRRATKDLPCEAFRRGACKKKSSQCLYSHDPQVLSTKKMEVCRFASRGCRDGDSCKYSHDTGRVLCRFFVTGGCGKGLQCPFSHTLPSSYLEREAFVKSHKTFLLTSLSRHQKQQMDFLIQQGGGEDSFLATVPWWVQILARQSPAPAEVSHPPSSSSAGPSPSPSNGTGGYSVSPPAVSPPVSSAPSAGIGVFGQREAEGWQTKIGIESPGEGSGDHPLEKPPSSAPASASRRFLSVLIEQTEREKEGEMKSLEALKVSSSSSSSALSAFQLSPCPSDPAGVGTTASVSPAPVASAASSPFPAPSALGGRKGERLCLVSMSGENPTPFGGASQPRLPSSSSSSIHSQSPQRPVPSRCLQHQTGQKGGGAAEIPQGTESEFGVPVVDDHLSEISASSSSSGSDSAEDSKEECTREEGAKRSREELALENGPEGEDASGSDVVHYPPLTSSVSDFHESSKTEDRRTGCPSEANPPSPKRRRETISQNAGEEADTAALSLTAIEKPHGLGDDPSRKPPNFSLLRKSSSSGRRFGWLLS
uniref:C3H1-type domain-containing protein n=1 Tax=Chromera velia CCMP2878 TaxID=1169474 RepID=A0A0G4I6I7_9ALVE|mmetsp:Transcript_49624/g.97796  ORF Transcript_49624/g.97796 Transcript_49624/m.97796 type:complete len:608 (-) Transcript_49624:104-1927(-)|eukprot:Cvel_11378.t1-p1 / transcript=Cvel_11378.t1 / gene=Cvel_11378 / organism=Chromera_velia_CCMP2878 / gene_product=Zinc finger CCCH domain-containing protein 65, putative / transcript_product=Zinc finger CCCH domain-containing protein 65, putative / location=Cvel_scaffold713:44492-47624(+) / protein_length=607 / sequence_SO=supercontig / SO=protein_coding / is_pseudo=false